MGRPLWRWSRLPASSRTITNKTTCNSEQKKKIHFFPNRHSHTEAEYQASSAMHFRALNVGTHAASTRLPCCWLGRLCLVLVSMKALREGDKPGMLPESEWHQGAPPVSQSRAWPTAGSTVFVNKVLLDHSHASSFTQGLWLFPLHGQSWAVVRIWMTCKTRNIYSLTLHRKGLQTSAAKHGFYTPQSGSVQWVGGQNIP